MQDKIYFETYTIRDVQEAMTIFSSYGKYPNVSTPPNTFVDSYIFRGQKNIQYNLLPSVLRKEEQENIYKLAGYDCSYDDSEWEITQISIEYGIIKRFYDLADKAGLGIPQVNRLRYLIDNKMDSLMGIQFLPTQPKEWLPNDLFEIAGLAQHYGLLTRLLDWTYDYKVALYFAVAGIYSDKDKDADCVVWALNHGYFNLMNYPEYLCPLRFFRPPYHNNKYLSAQQGLFTTWEIPENGDMSSLMAGNDRKAKPIDRRPLDELISNFIDKRITSGKYKADKFLEKKVLYQFVIPVTLKNDIIAELDKNGYSEEYLFPGFHGVTLKIKNQIYLPKVQYYINAAKI